MALTYLEEHKQMIDDYYGKGSTCSLVGSYNFALDGMAGARWDRGDRRASLDRNGPGRQNPSVGFRPAVEIKKFEI
ncbi:MAG: hypothetical protein HY602_02335 [Parcubacteria group bacterium]|nr:hypothetical protein [Parcubacteria group bacterium]